MLIPPIVRVPPETVKSRRGVLSVKKDRVAVAFDVDGLARPDHQRRGELDVAAVNSVVDRPAGRALRERAAGGFL